MRVGGGFESVPRGMRHGPADVEIEPPSGSWQPVLAAGRLVGWASPDTQADADELAETGRRLEAAERTHLLGRLDHKLRSAVLSLQESARGAAFGRRELLEAVYDQAHEVGRRATALAAAALEPKESARTVVLAAALRGTRERAVSVPSDALVRAPEPLLMDALQRVCAWTGTDGGRIDAERRHGWWRVSFQGARRPPDVPELGEPLIRLLVDMQLAGWLDVSAQDETAVFLPAVESR